MDLGELVDGIAPGLRALPDTLSGVRQAFETGDLGALADPTRIDTYAVLLVLVGGLYLFGCIMVRRLFNRRPDQKTVATENAEARANYQQSVKLPRTGNRGLLDRRTHRWIEPIRLGSVMVETKDKHLAIGATTGARKTTLIAHLIMQARRPCIVIAGDNSPYAKEAMLARGWRVWAADGRHGGLYVFEGTPNEAAQIVTVLLNPRRTAGDTGLQRGMARGVFRTAIQGMDDNHIPRDWSELRRALIEAGPPEGIPNRNFDAARANWLARIDELMAALGPALGHDISVLDCVRSECGLFFDLNAFSDLDMATAFGEAAVRLTQHAADKTGDFWWICDELALFDADLLGQIVRTCRIRRVKFVGASQIISDFGKVLRGLVKCWFVGEQTAADHESRDWCSKLTMGYAPPENFAEHATPPGFYYVIADGRTQSIQIPPWHHPKSAPPLTLYTTRSKIVPPPAGTVGNGSGMVKSPTESARRTVGFESDSVGDSVEAEGKWKPAPVVEGPPVMPRHWKSDAQLENIWLHHVFPGGADGCHVSTYRLNNRGRPMCSYLGVDWMAYMLSLAMADGLNLGEVKMRSAAGELTVDHLCQNVRCTKAEHLTWESRSRNSELLHERRRTPARVAAAD